MPINARPLEFRLIGPGDEGKTQEIKALFRRNGRPEFDDIIENAYPALGANSWIAVHNDQVVMHVGVFPCVLACGERAWNGGLVGDLMADAAHRTFFGPAALLRHVVRESAAASLDFLYSDPTPISVAVLHASGFEPVGILKRYVMPTGSLWSVFAALRGARAWNITGETAAEDPSTLSALDALLNPDVLRARRSGPVIRYRGGRDATMRWLSLQAPTADSPQACLMLVRASPDRERCQILDLAYGGAPPAGALLAATRWARSSGLRKVELVAPEGDPVAVAAQSVGYIRRGDSQPMMIRRLSEVMATVRAGPLFGSLDGSAWAIG